MYPGSLYSPFMIRNPKLFYVALATAFVGVIVRHGASIESSLGMQDVITSLPGPTLWLGIAGALIVLSLIPLGGAGRSTSRQDPRRLFLKEDIQRVATHVNTMTAQEEPDVRLIVDYTIFQAIAADASDIHFDPMRSGMALRYRVEGMMKDVTIIPLALAGPIANRLKVISNLVIYREALPQDGRFGKGGSGQSMVELERSGLAKADFRIAFMPTLHGERIVIRILGGGDDYMDFTELGMADQEQRIMHRLLEQPQGMVILTGPTGSGKSTTIYASLSAIQKQTHAVRSIATLEDPIEFDMEGINQSQVDEGRDFTFDKGLRAILRQDPDVIMVGEIRDPETARVAVQAGMTGHLIITTVHAGSSAASFSRLLEIGVAPYSLNSALTAVIAQRLVRKICTGCKKERGFTEHDLRDLDMATPPGDFKLFYGTGCEICSGSGYHGRTALFEILEVTEPIRKLVADGASADAIQQHAREAGMRSLFKTAIDAVGVGLTTPEEVARVISKDER